MHATCGGPAFIRGMLGNHGTATTTATGTRCRPRTGRIPLRRGRRGRAGSATVRREDGRDHRGRLLLPELCCGGMPPTEGRQAGSSGLGTLGATRNMGELRKTKTGLHVEAKCAMTRSAQTAILPRGETVPDPRGVWRRLTARSQPGKEVAA